MARGVEWLVRYQRFGEFEDSKEWPYSQNGCWSPRTCRSAAVKSLKALTSVPKKKQTRQIKDQIKSGAEYVLDTCLSDGLKTARPEWFRFGFPLMWSTDLLEILDVLLIAEYKDKRMREAIDCFVAKQDPEGKWNLETTYNGRVQVNIEKKGLPSKWITLRAMNVLKNFYA